MQQVYSEVDQDQSANSLLRSLGWVLWFALILVVLQRFTFWLRFPPLERAAIWIPGSYALAVLIRTRIRSWWTMYLAFWIAAITAFYSDPLIGPVRAVISAQFCFISIALGAYAIRRFGAAPALQCPRSLVVFLLVGVLFIPMLSNFPVFLTMGIQRLSDESSFWPASIALSMSHSVGYLIGTPVFLLIMLDCRNWLHRVGIRGGIEFASLTLVAASIDNYLFNNDSARGSFASLVLYLPLLPMVWGAMRFGVSGTSFCLALFAYQAVWGAIRGYGPFASQVPAENILHLQVYLLTFSLPLLILAAAIQERERALQNLASEVIERQSAELRFRRVVDFAPIAIIMIDSNGRIRMVNEFAEKTFACDRSVLLGQPAKSLFQDEFTLELIKSGKFTSSSSPHERARCTSARRYSGEAFIVDLTATRLVNSDGEFWLLALVDTTERMRAEVFREELAHRSRLVTLGSLATSLAHEINQPLGAIQSNSDAAELLLQTQRPPLDMLRLIVNDIRRDNLRASEVIKRMRAFLRHGLMEMRQLDPVEMIQEVVEFIKQEAQNRRVTLRTELTSSLPSVCGDKVHLQQVLLNLLINGLDAMRKCEGETELVIKAHANGEFLEIEVCDQGDGIEPTLAPRLFEQVFSTKEEGLGLGLIISRSLVESHGGQIGAENLPQGGARFWIRLPIHRDSHPTERTEDGLFTSGAPYG